MASPAGREPAAPRGPSWARARLRAPRYAGVWVATALLFAFSPLLAANSLHSSALLSMLPYAAMLAIAAIGQTIVVQQRGLDLSVTGMILLSTVIITLHGGGSNSGLPVGIVLVALACVASGLLSGLAITQLGITPVVATLGVNFLLTGTVYQLDSGQATASSPPALASFAADKALGIPNTAWIAVGAAVVIAVLFRATIPGRRFVAVGASPAAARAAGIRVTAYVVGTYILASLCYGAAGILLAGYSITPGLSAGEYYLLPTIAAVVLGGTSLAGGTGSVLASAIGALFLTQLQQILTANGAAQGIEDIIQGSIVAAGMLVRVVPWGRLISRVAPIAGPPRAAVAGGGVPLAGPDP